MVLTLIATTVALLPISEQTADGQGPEMSRQSGLSLSVRPYEQSVVEKSPLALRIALENSGPETAFVYFKDGREMRDPDLLTLYATDALGTRYEIWPIITMAASVVRGAGVPFLPGMRYETDHVMCLLRRGSGTAEGLTQTWDFLPPGRYEFHATLKCPKVISSMEFQLTVEQARDADAAVLEFFEMLPLYAQGASAPPEPDATHCLGGSPKEVISKIERIKSGYPTSVFVKWLRFWSVYYAMDTKDLDKRIQAIDNALDFAKANKSFPLTDNLLLRAAARLGKLGKVDQSQDALRILTEQYPDSDCAMDEIRKIESECQEEITRQKQQGKR